MFVDLFAEKKRFAPLCTCYIAQNVKFSIKDFSSKCDQIRSFLRIWSHLLEKSLMENFIFCTVLVIKSRTFYPAFQLCQNMTSSFFIYYHFCN